MTAFKFALIVACLTVYGIAQTRPAGLLSSKSPKVEIKGVIERVDAAPGRGMPSLELKVEKGTQRVLLGSMRYLMEHNFNPKAGSTAIVKGFLVDDLIVARSVSLPAENITLELRDEDGVPLWRMGRHGWRQK